MSDPATYVVGWICAITIEYVAAQEFLDEEHEGPSFVSPNDSNDYTLGKIGEHKVVLAVLPDGEYGTASAASVATNMLNSFPNVRIGLMVGIGGGVPSEKNDIRLGDVVVSASRDNKGGVFQYDFGKSIQGQSFQNTRFLNQPPTTLRTAITGIRAQYKRKGHRIEETINGIIARNARLRGEYQRPQSSTDRLYKPSVIHDPRGCAEFCANDPGNLLSRLERSEHEDNPAIHYGLIASANQLMKNALIRDNLAIENNILCFEMEAAGLMNNFPCLVVRGICDYSDSHKNKEWQGYAAMAAAAYAKDLLRRIPPNKIEAEKRIGDVLSGLQDVAQTHRNIAQKQLDIQESIVKQKLSNKQEECLHLFRLTSGTKDATYEWYKDHVEARVEGTCAWFLNHQNFKTWLEQDTGPLLVSADPGCGKSVLAKYLIDDRLPRSSTICYFFFRDQDQNTVRQALCALLHQLLSKKPSLVKYAMEEFTKDGPGLINSTKSLWTILGKAVQDPQAGPIIIVLDALDECAESEFGDLIRSIENQLHSIHSSHSKLKYLLTSRPYEQIVCKFTGLLKSFPYVRIPGEEDSESISQEVNHVIQYRVEQLAKEKRLPVPVKCHIAKRLLEIPHRTYLWVYLVFDYLMTEHFKKTPKGVDSTISTLPTNIYEAYERILQKSKKSSMVRRALSIVLAASRPLTLSEMNVALNVQSTSNSIHDLDLEGNEDFRSRLRTSCGLFLSIYHDKIFFLHQTAREFLLARPPSPVTPPSSLTTVPSETCWQHSITSQDAHNVLAEVCVVYLDFLNNDIGPTEASGEPDQFLDMYTFLDYSARNWGTHYLKASINAGDDLISSTLRICNPASRSWSAWFAIYWDTTYSSPTQGFTSLMISSYFGLEAVVMALPGKGTDLESKDKLYGQTPLAWATMNGHETVVKLLLSKSADYESKNNYGRTPLSFAAENGDEVIAKILLNKGADYESNDNFGRTPLSWAAENGHDAVVNLLLKKGANFESKDKESGQTPLSWAAQNGHGAIVKLLLEKDADIESKDSDGLTPLSLATGNGHENIVHLLLEKEANFKTENNYGSTPLFFAAGSGHETIVNVLLEKGADFESKNILDQTPLLWAIVNGHEAIVKLLLEKRSGFESKDEHYSSTLLLFAAQNGNVAVVELLLAKGADIESNDKYGRRPLSWAVGSGHEAVIKLLLARGANFEAKDNDGWTPLAFAAGDGDRTIVELLLEKGADVEPSDNSGRVPLSWAAWNGHVAIVELLLTKGAEVESKDKEGRTPLFRAAEKGHEAVVHLLLKKGADIEAKDNDGWTPLFWAAGNGQEAVVELLITKGADVESKDNDGRAPLFCATRNGHEAVVKILLLKGAGVGSKDSNGRTPLSWVSWNGNDAIIKLLLVKGAEVESKDNYGWTPLSWAAGNGHEAIVRLLLTKSAGVDSKDNDGWTPLFWAAWNGHDAVVKILLERGADFESKDSNGRTPLSWVSWNGDDAAIKLLLVKDAEVESKDKDGRTPLFWAVEKGHEDVVHLLLEKGADIESKDNDGWTPLFWAAWNGHDAVVKILLERGADFESKSKHGRSLLSCAAEDGDEAIINLLLEKGADVESKDNGGRTPLSWAAWNGHEAIVRLLIEEDANIETKDDQGWTPLSFAAGDGDGVIVELLLEKGANIKSKDRDGRTPLFWATENGHEAIVELLLE